MSLIPPVVSSLRTAFFTCLPRIARTSQPAAFIVTSCSASALPRWPCQAVTEARTTFLPVLHLTRLRTFSIGSFAPAGSG